jgi:hypothetical protein
MDGPFDLNAIKDEANRSEVARTECIDYCRAALQNFVEAAKQLETKPVHLPKGHVAARAAGVSKPWPAVGGFGDKEYRYYRILRQNWSDNWAANDGRGLTVSLDGRTFYLESRETTIEKAAHFTASLVDHDRDVAKRLFEDALRGEARSFE